ncbi:methionyl-tRNA formyltransferase [Candidatus Peregrinibacteria bacterium]|nr:methionyl-tRNA formyltransferase [Candidatus Peregrinibacteria bacterium]
MDNKIKLIFYGTPDIAARCLQALVEDDSFEVLAVVTQEDKPVGRKQIMTAPPVKVYAEGQGISAHQPEKLGSEDSLFEELSSLGADYNVVVAYGQMMPQRFLDFPRLRSVNLHVSLLPAYRGASPMQEALKNGDSVTGVTVQEMALKMDRGPILGVEEIVITPDDTIFELYEKSGLVGADLLKRILKEDFSEAGNEGNISPTLQDESKASYCSKITKKDGEIDFTVMTAGEVYNKYRAYKMWPGIYSFWNGKRVKLTEVKISEDTGSGVAPGAWGKDKDRLFVKCKDGVIEILRCQLEGKKEMSVAEVLRGM